MCRSSIEVLGGLYCASWCSTYSCGSQYCKGCMTCQSGYTDNGLIPGDGTFVSVYDGKLISAEDECVAPAATGSWTDGQTYRVPQYCCDIPHMGYTAVQAKMTAGDYASDPYATSPPRTVLTPGNYVHGEPIQSTRPLREIMYEAGGNCVGLALASLYSDPTGSVTLADNAPYVEGIGLPGTGQGGSGVRYYNSCDAGIPTVDQSCIMPGYPEVGGGWQSPAVGIYSPGTDFMAITIAAKQAGPVAGGCHCPPTMAFTQPGCYYGAIFGSPDTRAITINITDCIPKDPTKPYFPSYSGSSVTTPGKQ
jgi:hypothetical protein